MVDWGYVAGYFDGEGCVSVPKPGDVNTRDCRLTWSNTNKESLEAIQALIRCGIMTSRDKSAMGWKTIHQLRVSRRLDLMRICPELISRCIVKREALERCLAVVTATRPNKGYGKIAGIGIETIRAMYFDDFLSTERIGKKVGVGSESVRKFLVEHGIALRTPRETVMGNTARGRTRLGIIPDDVRRMYWMEGLCLREIAAHYGVDRERVHSIMRRHGIPRRSVSESYAARAQRQAEGRPDLPSIR